MGEDTPQADAHQAHIPRSQETCGDDAGALGAPRACASNLCLVSLPRFFASLRKAMASPMQCQSPIAPERVSAESVLRMCVAIIAKKGNPKDAPTSSYT